jgi:hypothetical protein
VRNNSNSPTAQPPGPVSPAWRPAWCSSIDMSCQKDTSMRNTAIRTSHPVQPENKKILALLTRVLIAATFASLEFLQKPPTGCAHKKCSHLTCEPGTILNSISRFSEETEPFFSFNFLKKHFHQFFKNKNFAKSVIYGADHHASNPKPGSPY